MTDLTGKIVAVAGGTGGMGSAICAVAVVAGVRVIVFDLDEAKAVDAAARLGDARGVGADLSSEQAAAEAFARVGPVDYVAMPIGGDPASGKLTEVDAEAARAAFEAKFWSQLWIARGAAAEIRPGGSMLLWSGVVSRRPSAGSGVLSAVNGGVEGLGRALAIDLAPIRVNVISPGLIDTPAYAAMPAEKREAMFEAVRDRVPAHRVGAPEDVAALALAILSNPNMTGTVVDIDGGAAIA